MLKIDNIEYNRKKTKKNLEKNGNSSHCLNLYGLIHTEMKQKKTSLAELSAYLQRYLVTATLGCQFGQRGNDWQESAQKKYFTHSLAKKRFPVLVFLGKG